MKFSVALGTGVSAAALMLLPVSPALAQTAPDAATAEEEAPVSDADIVVMAQGRAQALADVPVAISAVNAETLQNSGANDIRQLNQVAPSLIVSSTGSEANGSARIRGIGTVGDNPGLESSVPVFIDGVYRSRSGIGLNELGEIDRVEVQRGPQGTLGGRNSSAGLISIYSKKPQFQFGASGEATYGNFDLVRLAGSITGPITDKVAARIDGVYVRRDGFLHDATNNIDVNNRNRFFVRGQLLFEPTSDLTVRLIADYTWRKERCCGAVYVDSSVNPYIGNLNNLSTPLSNGLPPPNTGPQANGNNIVNVLRDLGQPLAALNQGYGRDLSVSAGRSYEGVTKDYGFSGEIKYDLGGATLTSITAYRQYRAGQAGDVDYSKVDLLYRTADDNNYRQFHTFTQEFRLQGEAFGGKLDWLVGGFYADEKLTVRDNLKFGSQYGRFATCRIISGGGLAGLYDPTQGGCVAGGIANPAGVGRNTIAFASGASGPDIVSAFTALEGMANVGSTRDEYRQHDRNWALFTHNIIHITDKLDLTLGLRYTNDKKDFGATFGNNNTVCTTVQGLVLDDLTSQTSNATAKALAGALLGLSCQGNSTAELNGVSIASKRSEDQFTGTAILSYKLTDDLMTYASFSRGYKAGGFNLDRSALKSPIAPFAATPGGAQALVGNLQFAPELVNSYELGAKYATGPFSASLTFFRSDFTSFQLNTFDGTVFLVQNINGCETSLGGADRDTSAATGACAADKTSWGVRAEGFELETVLNPSSNFRVTAGLTHAKTKYRSDLVANSAGSPLSPALRWLPGKFMSNAPEFVVTASAAWTPDIGNTGLSALVYVDARTTSDYNTGSDLFPQKGQDGFSVVNARLGLRGPGQKWSLEFWVQNLFDKDYAQVAFNTPFQAGTAAAPFNDANNYPGGSQLFSQFLAEPRTLGVTVRGKF
ncbi:MAG: TonB-dependent receptor [Novosphingobium sp.]